MFRFGADHILVSVAGNHITFANTEQGMVQATIEGLRLSKSGVMKEFPDLKDNPDWATEAVKRFKDKVSTLGTEELKVNYIIEDLRKHGYIPMYKQKGGFRPERIV